MQREAPQASQWREHGLRGEGGQAAPAWAPVPTTHTQEGPVPEHPVDHPSARGPRITHHEDCQHPPRPLQEGCDDPGLTETYGDREHTQPVLHWECVVTPYSMVDCNPVLYWLVQH